MIKIGIVGYGNLGKGVIKAIEKQNDMEVYGVFSKRNLDVQGLSTYAYDSILDHKGKLDVLVLCGSSEKDLREQSPYLAQHFNIIDSFDMHAIILDHVNEVGKNASKTTALVSVGWDPGIFSLEKTILDSILPDGKTQSFWGNGISQGHTDVSGRVEGVTMARSYSIPNQDNINDFRDHKAIDVSKNHHKICYVVAEKDHDRIEKEILNIPHYFKGQSAEVRFISQEEMDRDHSQWPQAGRIIRAAQTSQDVKHTIDLSIKLDSNPEFTATCLVAYARACYKMNQREEFGVFTTLDVRPSDMSSKDTETLIKEML